MPKENTHLYFAHQAVEVLSDEKLANLIRQEMGYFYFGAVIPDTFYYARNRHIVRISEYLHGRHGNLTNEFIFDLLKKAKETRSEKDLVFALGYITHCVLDIVFHPVIYYLSGNYYDPNQVRADEAVYLHRHLETVLDQRVNQSFYFSRLIHPDYLDELSFDEVVEKKFRLPSNTLYKMLKRKAWLLHLPDYNFIYYILLLLFSTGLIKRPVLLCMFYANLSHDDRTLPEFIEYQDIITGEQLTTSIQDLFSRARGIVNDRILAAYGYFTGELKKEEAMEIIKGESLSTGREGVAVNQIKYYYDTQG